jgi:hypothetical protein
LGGSVVATPPINNKGSPQDPLALFRASAVACLLPILTLTSIPKACTNEETFHRIRRSDLSKSVSLFPHIQWASWVKLDSTSNLAFSVVVAGSSWRYAATPIIPTHDIPSQLH